MFLLSCLRHPALNRTLIACRTWQVQPSLKRSLSCCGSLRLCQRLSADSCRLPLSTCLPVPRNDGATYYVCRVRGSMRVVIMPRSPSIHKTPLTYLCLHMPLQRTFPLTRTESHQRPCPSHIELSLRVQKLCETTHTNQVRLPWRDT